MIFNGPRSRVRLFMTSDRDPVSEQSLVLNWDYGTASANLNHSVELPICAACRLPNFSNKQEME